MEGLDLLRWSLSVQWGWIRVWRVSKHFLIFILFFHKLSPQFRKALWNLSLGEAFHWFNWRGWAKQNFLNIFVLIMIPSPWLDRSIQWKPGSWIIFGTRIHHTKETPSAEIFLQCSIYVMHALGMEHAQWNILFSSWFCIRFLQKKWNA